jgi:hypothetical protein
LSAEKRLVACAPMVEPAISESPLPTASLRPRVIYIMGAGRSGSTILGVTLGNCERIFYAGELDAWLTRSGEPPLEDPERARFWGGVREGMDGASALFGRRAERALERSLSVFRVNRWAERRRLRVPYRRVAENLYREIARAAGTPLIVDSSHYPLRARELQAVEGIDLFLLYLIRDPQSVVASFNRKDVAQYTKSTLTTNVYLWLTNLLAMWVFARQPSGRRVFVRYEDFVADPEAIVTNILRRVGVAVPPPDFASLRTGVAFLGNRLIKSETVTLRVGQPGSVERPSRLTSVLQLPWLLVLSRLRPVASAGGG